MRIRNAFGTEFSGALGKSIVASSWKGRPYLRAYVVPRNPRTELQQENRGRFADAVRAWRALPAERRAAYNRDARGMSGYNLFIREFMAAENEKKR